MESADQLANNETDDGQAHERCCRLPHDAWEGRGSETTGHETPLADDRPPSSDEPTIVNNPTNASIERTSYMAPTTDALVIRLNHHRCIFSSVGDLGAEAAVADGRAVNANHGQTVPQHRLRNAPTTSCAVSPGEPPWRITPR